MKGYISIAAALIALILSGCSDSAGDGETNGEKRLKITATTGMIADAARNIAGDRADVVGLMGPGVDPHLYKATPGDLRELQSADLILYNGLHLEGKMGEVFEKLARTKPVVAVAEGLDPAKLRKPAEFEGNYDPHIWFDVALWSGAVRNVANALKEQDPEGAAIYEKNAAAFIAKLDSLDAWVRQRMNEVPKEHRILVTAHDAFGYFGQAYDVEVRGLQGISTLSEFGLADLREVIDMIVERKVNAVFIESSVPKRSIEALVEGVRDRGHEVRIGGELFSDAMGEDGTPEGTYIGMVSANVNTIANALK